MTTTINVEYTFHPILNIFRQPTDQEKERAIERVKLYGQRERIEAIGTEIVAGALEYIACAEAGVPVHITVIDPPEDLVQYVVRRYIPQIEQTFMDRCCVAVEAKDYHQAEAKKRMVEGGRKGGLAKGGTEMELPFAGERWFHSAARIVGVKNANAIRDLAIIKNKAPDVYEGVRRGEIPQMNDARQLSREEPKARKAILARLKAEKGNVGISAAIQDQRKKENIKKLPKALFDGGDYKVVAGDMAEKGSEIPDASVNLVFADLVYGVAGGDMASKVAALAARVLVPGGVLAVVPGHVRYEQVVDEMVKAGFHGVAIGAIAYPDATHGLTDHGSIVKKVNVDPVLYFTNDSQKMRPISSLLYTTELTVDESKQYHKWQKPSDVMLKIVMAAAGPETVVLDPCCGSGTTGLAALKVGSKFIGLDINKENAELSARRLTKFQEEKAAGAVTKILDADRQEAPPKESPPTADPPSSPALKTPKRKRGKRGVLQQVTEALRATPAVTAPVPNL